MNIPILDHPIPSPGTAAPGPGGRPGAVERCVCRDCYGADPVLKVLRINQLRALELVSNQFDQADLQQQHVQVFQGSPGGGGGGGGSCRAVQPFSGFVGCFDGWNGALSRLG